MRDTDLYAQILGIKSPWFVENVQLDVVKGRVDISLGHEPGVLWACPRCGKQLSCRDHAEERWSPKFGQVCKVEPTNEGEHL